MNLLEIKDTNKHLTEVAETISSDQSISNSKITVWVDPLDATKEYTGITIFCPIKGPCKELLSHYIQIHKIRDI